MSNNDPHKPNIVFFSEGYWSGAPIANYVVRRENVPANVLHPLETGQLCLYDYSQHRGATAWPCQISREPMAPRELNDPSEIRLYDSVHLVGQDNTTERPCVVIEINNDLYTLLVVNRNNDDYLVVEVRADQILIADRLSDSGRSQKRMRM